jgi:apolipoprotein N-acyltransferase
MKAQAKEFSVSAAPPHDPQHRQATAEIESSDPRKSLPARQRLKDFGQTAWWVIISAAAILLAYCVPQAAFLIVLYLFGLVQLAHSRTWREAFYAGLSVGLLVAGVRLEFFWRIFGSGGLVLWLVYAFWVGLFVALARLCLIKFKAPIKWLMVPVLWLGLEYFRSELYYLRFSWLSPGFVFGGLPSPIAAHYLGGYGIGFVLMALACAGYVAWTRWKMVGPGLLLGCSLCLAWMGRLVVVDYNRPPSTPVRVAGIQMEFPTEGQVLRGLDAVLRAYPAAELLVLSEYTFQGPVPENVRKWCREHKRYLIVGGEEPAGKADFYDTAYVISPQGSIEFQQAKSVPIQFFRDGLPAREQQLWNSPWGKIGICICYDLSFSRVTDRLIDQGAQALIVPTMDVVDWGPRQHELHALVAPLRSSEYGVPIFRVASSGISQLVDAMGRVKATAPCPGNGTMLSGIMELKSPGRLPLDRWLAPIACVLMGLFVVACLTKPRATHT